jgi:hypothetical protein
MPNVFLEKLFFRKKTEETKLFCRRKNGSTFSGGAPQEKPCQTLPWTRKKTALALAQAREVPEELQFLGFYRLCYSTMQFLTEILC